MKGSARASTQERLAAWSGALLLLSFALSKFLIHVLAAPAYGWFRDELYYLDCSKHLAWGYVDHPPLSIFLLRLARSFLGDSLRAVRLLPAVAGAATVFLTGWIARQMGGGRFAQALAMTAVLAAPFYLALDHFYSMNALDLVFWPLAAAILIRILERGDGRLWLVLGVVLGLGLLNKISVLWLGFGLLAGLLLTSQRSWCQTRWPWIAAGIATALFLPHLVWQALHGWPTLEFMRNATRWKMAPMPPLRFLGEQALGLNPITLPIWGAGLLFLLLSKSARRLRPLGILYLAVLALLAGSGTSRPSYVAPAYPMLFAAGGAALERAAARWNDRRLRAGILALTALGGAVLAPFGLPVLPVETFIRYSRLLRVGPLTHENLEVGALPQHFADMFGWEAIVEAVAEVYRRLPPEDRAAAGIFARNYGEAGALNLLGRRYGLPRAISGHNTYWLWGPGDTTGEVMIVLGGEESELRQVFETVVQAGTTHCGYCMPYENHQPIYVCRGLKVPLGDLWPRLKLFI